MTLKEVSALLGISEFTLRKNFVRTQINLQKKGILLTKWGRGKNAEYEIEYERYDLLEDEDRE